MSDEFKEKLRSLSFSTGKSLTQRREDQLSADLDAYSRLKKNGVQPRGIDGSAHLETRATDKVEIDYGLAATPKGLKKAKQLVADIGQS